MKYASVSSSDITRFGRMDAGFHIAYQEVQKRVAELEAKFGGDPSKALALLERLPTPALECLDVLGTGTTTDISRSKMRRTSCQRYPFIALALVERNLANLRSAAQAEVDAAKAAEAVLTDLQSALKP